MIPRLQKIYAFVLDEINNPMILSQSPRPDSGSQIFKRLRLPNPFKWITHHTFDQCNSTECGFLVRLYPMLQIFDEFRLEDGFTFFQVQGQPQDATLQ